MHQEMNVRSANMHQEKNSNGQYLAALSLFCRYSGVCDVTCTHTRRVALGRHYVSDVIAGSVLGALVVAPTALMLLEAARGGAGGSWLAALVSA